MSNLLNANLPSEDEEDQDYVPDEVDEEERRLQKQQSKKPKRLRGAAAGAGAAADDEEEEEAGGGAAGQGGGEVEDEDEQLPDSKREAKKAKVDALWSQLNRKPAAVLKPAGGGGLAGLRKPAAGGKAKSSGDEVRAQPACLPAVSAGCRMQTSSLMLPAGPPAGPPLGQPHLPTTNPMLLPATSPPHLQAWMRQLGLAPKPKAAPAAAAAAAAGSDEEEVEEPPAAASAPTAAAAVAAAAAYDGMPDLDALSEGLPPGWRAMWDKTHRLAYYGHLQTKVSTPPFAVQGRAPAY